MRVGLFLFYVLFATSLFGQARVDSLAAAKQVDSLILISRSFAQKGSFGQALDIGLSAEQLGREKIGRMSASYGKISFWLGAVFRINGDMINAEKWDIEGMIIRESLFGKVNIEYAQSLIQYSGTCALMGDLEKSETLLLEAKAILEQLDARESSHYGTLMNSLGNLYADLGNWEKAESCYLQALAIREKILGKEHPTYGATLSNLGLLYLQARRYTEAETYMLEALAMREKSFGKEHPFYAISLNNLGYLYFTLKQYDKAESYYLETLAIREKKLGKENPDYARCLHNLAGVNFRLGRLEKAESLYLEAKAIAEKTIGQQGDLYQQALVEIAQVYEFQNRFDESTQLVIDAFELLQKPLSRSVNFLSEQELFNYVSTFETSNNFLNSILYSRIFRTGNMVQSNGLSSLDFDQALYYKGFLLNNIIRINNLASLNPESAEIMRLLKINRRRLAAEYAKPIAERKNLSELEEKANTFEKELANTSAGYAETMHQIKWPEVQAALKPGEVAIEFVHFQVNSPKPTDSTIYAALLLLPGTKTPQFIPLCEERALESLLKTSRARKSDYVNRLYGNHIPAAQTSLYSLIWEPLAATMVGVKTVYFSPSGLLCRVNLGAIPVREDEILSDRFRFVELGSTRSIAEGTKTSKLALPSLDAGQVQRNEAQLWGGIQYESDSTAIQNANAGLMNSFSASRGELGFEQTDTASRGGENWTFLPWTEKEINAIFPILKSAGIQPTLRKGYGATEEMFQVMSTRSPRIVHIATHGYFFPDPKTEQRKEILGSNETCPTFKISDHPMIRSGLLLAGANQAWKTGKPFKPGMEDGILTAYEISQMDLSNTELVVLSACETGLGDIQGNEGVYGLQRAFKIAGAKYLIMSLWQVPDFQTQELMTTFYTNWLPSAAEAMAGKTEKMSIPDAFRAAQQTMREKYEHPYFWAGFVLVE